MDPREHFGALIDREARALTGEPDWRAALRKDAASAFSGAGFPTTRHEDWRYTSVSSIARTPWALPRDGTGRLTRAHVEGVAFPVYACSLYVLVNGRFSPALSAPRAIAAGVQVRSLATFLTDAPAWLAEAFGHVAPIDDAPFTALNTALCHDGAVLEIPAGTRLDQPVHIVHLALPGGTDTATFPRTLVMARSGSEATVIEDHVSLGDGEFFTCAVSEVIVEDGARLDHVKLQRESLSGRHLGALHARIGRDARLVSHVFSTGAAMARNELRATIAGPGGACDLLGLYVASGSQVVANHTTIDHAAQDGTSRELYKGILDGRSRGVFHGRVIVRNEAQRTDAKQSNKNLLLSRDAEVDSKPQLEISADDVKCSHGATIGRLEDEALFYLRARGIDEAEARRLLLRAFAAEVTGAIRLEPLRQEVEQMLLARLHLAEDIETPR